MPEEKLEWKPSPNRKAGKLGGIAVNKELYEKQVKLRRVLTASNLPVLLASYNVQKALSVVDNNMDGNDTDGDCVEAMSAHLERCFQKIQTGAQPTFPTTAILAQYLAETGGADVGLDPIAHLQFWQGTGLLLDGVNRCQIDNFVTVDLASDEELKYCIMLLNGAAACLNVPQSAIDQFNAGEPWDVVANDGGSVGLHGVAILAYDNNYYCMTWGDLQPMTPAFYHKYFYAAFGIVDSEDKWVNPATDPINVPLLEQYASEITSQPLPPAPVNPPQPTPSPCKVGNAIAKVLNKVHAKGWAASLLNIYSRTFKRKGRFFCNDCGFSYMNPPIREEIKNA
jgi:hypothetical protein